MSNKFIDSIKHVIIEDDDPKPEAQAAGTASDPAGSGARSRPCRSRLLPTAPRIRR